MNPEFEDNELKYITFNLKGEIIMKKIAIYALCLAMTVMMAGCGSKEKKNETIDARSGGAAEKNMAVAEYDGAEEKPAADGVKNGEVMEAADDCEMFYGEKGEAGESFVEAVEYREDGPAKNNAEAGILTAGRWNDNNNWGFFSNLVNTDAISFPSFGINPCCRVCVTVKNSEGTPLPNKKVSLVDKDNKTIWSSVSDKNGVAYLFCTDGSEAAQVTAELNDGTVKSTEISVKGNGSNEQGQDIKVFTESAELVIDESAVLNKNMEVMFIMDATGSMSDEMMFLQKDFSEIAASIGTENTKYSVDFYRDEGDEYITRCFDFTDDIKQIQNELNEQSASGGGDYPEAVAQILDETMHDASWSDDAVKLAFLIFDAPPHTGTEEQLIYAIKSASEKGIHIIPVVSSNADRDTELFGRAISLCTNGEYVFLTDDSGVGGSHLEPIIGSYEVEKLYDVIVNIINEHKQ